MQRFLKTVLLLAFITIPLFALADEVPVRGLTHGRIKALVPGILALISVIVGGLALRAANRNGSGKRGAIVSLVLGAIALAVAALHIVECTSGIGTGSGKLGAIVAMILGAIGLLLGGMALNRHRKALKR